MQTTHSAEQLLRKAAEIMAERGKQYDSTGQQKERSMGRIIAAFNALYGTQLTEQQGWHFMVLLKLARQKDKPHADSMEDAIAYTALAAEAGFTQLGAMPTPQHLPQADVLANYEATAQELTRELEQARSEIFSLEQALKQSIEQRDSLHAQVLEATASADKWHDRANSLENILRINEQAALAKIQQLKEALLAAQEASLERAANACAVQLVTQMSIAATQEKQAIEPTDPVAHYMVAHNNF